MSAAFAELPLALFTTLAPIGAGGFAVLAIAFATTAFPDGQLRRIDTLTAIPLVAVLAGFAASFFHLASPMHAPGALAHVGESPLSNEILAGCIFTVLAIVYFALAVAGKMTPALRKGLSALVAVAAVVFACLIGAAYMIETVIPWNSPATAISMLGLALVGGGALVVMMLAAADALGMALETAFKPILLVVLVLALVMALGGLGVQYSSIAGSRTAVADGAMLASEALAACAIGIVCLVAAAVATYIAVRGGMTPGGADSATGVDEAGAEAAVSGFPATTMAVAATLLVLVGVFSARLAFYAMQMSVGL